MELNQPDDSQMAQNARVADTPVGVPPDPDTFQGRDLIALQQSLAEKPAEAYSSLKDNFSNASENFLEGVTLSGSSIAKSLTLSDAEKQYIYENKMAHPFESAIFQFGGLALADIGLAAVAPETFGGSVAVGVAGSARVLNNIRAITQAGIGGAKIAEGVAGTAASFASMGLVTSTISENANLWMNPKNKDAQIFSSNLQESMQDIFLSMGTSAMLGAGLHMVGGIFGEVLKPMERNISGPQIVDGVQLDPAKITTGNIDDLLDPRLDKMKKFFGIETPKDSAAGTLADFAEQSAKADIKVGSLGFLGKLFQDSDAFYKHGESIRLQSAEAGITDIEQMKKAFLGSVNPEHMQANQFLKVMSYNDPSISKIWTDLAKGDVQLEDVYTDFVKSQNLFAKSEDLAKKYSTPKNKLNGLDDISQVFHKDLSTNAVQADVKAFNIRTQLSEALDLTIENLRDNKEFNDSYQTAAFNNMLIGDSSVIGQAKGLIENNEKTIYPVNSSLIQKVKNVIKAIENKYNPPKGIYGEAVTAGESFTKGLKTADMYKDMQDLRGFLNELKYDKDVGKLSPQDEQFIGTIKNSIDEYHQKYFGEYGDLVSKKSVALNELSDAMREYSTIGYNDRLVKKVTQTIKRDKQGNIIPSSLKLTQKLQEKIATRLMRLGKRGQNTSPITYGARFAESRARIANAVNQVEALGDLLKKDMRPYTKGLLEDVDNIGQNVKDMAFYNEKRQSAFFGKPRDLLSATSGLPPGEPSMTTHAVRMVEDAMSGNLMYAKYQGMRIIMSKTLGKLFHKENEQGFIKSQLDMSRKLQGSVNSTKITIKEAAASIVDGFSALKPGMKAVVDTVNPIKNTIPYALMIGSMEYKKQIDRDFIKHKAMNSYMRTNPLEYQAAIQSSLSTVRRLSPELAEQIGEIYAQKLSMLQNYMPNDMNGALKVEDIPMAAKTAYLDQFDALFNGNKMCKLVGNGTITYAQMQTFKGSQPVLYNEIKNEIYKKTLEKELPSEIKNKVNRMFDIQDAMSVTAAINTASMTYQAMMQQEVNPGASQQKGRPANPNRVNKLNSTASLSRSLTPEGMD